MGTGIVYGSNGRILTNYHVIKGAYSAKITIAGKSYTIKSVLAYDSDLDLAMLQADATGLNFAKVSSDEQKAGQTVYTVGSSKGFTNTYSRGIITYASRNIDGVTYVQHDAAISGGNSGGPLINEYGEVIGVNTMAVNDSQNLNFAIAISEVQKLSFETPLTMKAFYEKEGNAFKIIAEELCKVGVESNGIVSHKITIDNEMFTISYDKKTNKISVIYEGENNGTNMRFELILNSDLKNFDFVMSAYLDSVEITATGSQSCAGYTFGGKLEADKISEITKGSDLYDAFMQSGSLMISAELIALEYFAYVQGLDVGISEMGFAAFVASIS